MLQTDIKRGSVASESKKDPASDTKSFNAQVIVINHPGLIKNGYCPMMDIHTAHTRIKFNKILQRLDKRSGKVKEVNPEGIRTGDASLIEIIPHKPTVVEVFNEYPPLGRFSIRDMSRTIGVGVVKEVKKKL
jgi:elongation factor 1-alpha